MRSITANIHARHTALKNSMAPPGGKGGANVRRGEERGDWPDDSCCLHCHATWAVLFLFALLGNSGETFGPIPGALGQVLLLIDPEQTCDVIQPLFIFKRQVAARPEYLLDQSERFAARFSIIRVHRRNSREGGRLVDQR